MVRFVVSGSEATMSAVRVARAATKRPVVIKFAGAYHGHADMFLVAAVIAEPVVGNMGCVPPDAGFLQFLRDRCTANGALLILDEVMTGFRVARGGAAARYGVTPDLITLGKIVGGGMPLAAFGGRRSLMEMVAPEGPVYQAGTFAAHPLSIAAGLAMLDAIDEPPDLYDVLEARGASLQSGMTAAADAVRVPVSFQRVASMWTMFFSERPVRSWDDAGAVDRDRYARFFRAMLSRNVLLPPSPFEAAFISMAHDGAVISETIDAARASLKEALA
jgi:glutamate-1-semialdehyde 2,1-aminomutase